VIYTVLQELRKTPVKFLPPLHVALVFIGVTGDVDNYTKHTLDGLKEAIHIDDKFFHPLTIDKRSKGRGENKGAIIAIWNAQTVEESPVPTRTLQKSMASKRQANSCSHDVLGSRQRELFEINR
jgi:hypothetical protein